MWLYHGTYDMFYSKIIKDGVILARSKNKDSSTGIVDRVINTIAGKIVRGNNVYLTNEIEALDGFDRSIRISTSMLNTRKLFVADTKYIDLMLCRCTENNKNFINYAGLYLKNFITFDRYISNRKHYDCTRLNEFLYYDNIYLRRKRLG